MRVARVMGEYNPQILARRRPCSEIELRPDHTTPLKGNLLDFGSCCCVVKERLRDPRKLLYGGRVIVLADRELGLRIK